ncbi:MAG: hypothetical protein WKG00_40725, partial [Polyangiaceae bacterium]
INIGPVVVRLGIVEAAKKQRDTSQRGVLDADVSGAVPAVLSRRPPIAPGGEDPYVRQLVPYIETYRAAWSGVYRVVYETVSRLPAELRGSYLGRLGLEHPAVGTESDFRSSAPTTASTSAASATRPCRRRWPPERASTDAGPGLEAAGRHPHGPRLRAPAARRHESS